MLAALQIEIAPLSSIDHRERDPAHHPPAVPVVHANPAPVIAAVGVGVIRGIAGVVGSPAVHPPNAGRSVVISPPVRAVPRDPGVVSPSVPAADGAEAGVSEAPVAANAKAPGPEAAPGLGPLGRQGNPKHGRD